MDCLRKMVNSVGKGLSSNKLLKCVLLNTAVELFGCMNAPSYFVTPVQSYYWDMENFDHLYATLQGAHSQCPDDNTDTTSLTERITEEVHTADLQVTEEHKELPEPEQTSSLKTLLDLDVNTWLGTTAENVAESDKPQSTQKQFYFLIPADVITHAISMLSDTEMEASSVHFTDCGVQTEPDKANTTIKNLDCDTEISFYDLLNCVDGVDTTPSIFWDSYDLHEFNTETICVPENWCTPIEDFCSYEDFILMDISKPSEGDGETPVSSTPWLNRRKPRM